MMIYAILDIVAILTNKAVTKNTENTFEKVASITHEENVLPSIDSYSFYEEFRNKQHLIAKIK